MLSGLVLLLLWIGIGLATMWKAIPGLTSRGIALRSGKRLTGSGARVLGVIGLFAGLSVLLAFGWLVYEVLTMKGPR